MFRGLHEGMGAGGWILMSLFWIALVAVIVWAIARIVPGRSGEALATAAPPVAAHQRAQEPIAILDRRLAAGEIDSETYDQLRSKLTGDAAAGRG